MTEASERKAAGWPARLMDTRGVRVRIQREATTGSAVIPAGTLGVIEGDRSSWEKLLFRADRCECCGVQPRLNASWRRFEVVR